MIVEKDENYVLVRMIEGKPYFGHLKDGASCVDFSVVEGSVEDADLFDTPATARKAVEDQKDEGWQVRVLRTVYHLGGVVRK